MMRSFNNVTAPSSRDLSPEQCGATPGAFDLARFDRHLGVRVAHQYALDVLAGVVPACKWVKAACQRQLDDLARADANEALIENGEAPEWPYVFDAAAADRAIRFCELLPHVKGQLAGRLISLEPWQKFGLACVFGWRVRGTDEQGGPGLRRFRSVYEEVPRKNAKTTRLAGVSLYMLAADGEPGAECYSAATTADQARIVFEIAQQMARMTPQYRHRFGVEVLAHALIEHNSASKLRPLAAEGGSLDGLNIHFAGVDELHAHKTRALWDVLDSGMGARTQPLMWAITTAGSNRAGICYERRQHATHVLNAVLRRHDGLGYRIEGNAADDDTVFGIIYTIDEGDDPLDESSWRKANPNYGVSVSDDDMRRMATFAKANPSAMANFLTKRLNVWVAAEHAWMDMGAWGRCADPDLVESEFAGADCWVGIDAAHRVDVYAKAKVFRRHGVVYAFLRYYVPHSRTEGEGNEHFAGWASAGQINVCPGVVVDQSMVTEDLEHDMREHNVREIGYDPAQITGWAIERAQQGWPMVEIRPSVLNFSEPMKELEAWVREGKFRHNGDPVLEWMVANVVCHRDRKDNIYPNKEKPENKIDGVVALLIAINRMLGAEAEVVPAIIAL